MQYACGLRFVTLLSVERIPEHTISLGELWLKKLKMKRGSYGFSTADHLFILGKDSPETVRAHQSEFFSLHSDFLDSAIFLWLRACSIAELKILANLLIAIGGKR